MRCTPNTLERKGLYPKLFVLPNPLPSTGGPDSWATDKYWPLAWQEPGCKARGEQSLVCIYSCPLLLTILPEITNNSGLKSMFETTSNLPYLVKAE